ncbi:NAD dependent deacetylase putative transcriptional regulator Sir2 family protein NaMN 5 6-dimethylbenzimidazole (cobb) protein [Leptomonas seymouri]|uniref:NAD-dependent protein deacylase n=1 Tax=Leptomonas seymouri TaxID=5684 RepID=A0A0N1PFL5_LEPSE|nr:NAD dependent deacetylase putative transcriptional regulator Sir2 family protein NaMN 5 6-dimethylbenzimidazole (cobb) protein [Leptomonas seymouri]|eukprot:KPI90462.1 NAD dependent deacetylase putative transcriptional regulator Sir2 family protein NaMN 5 6-dimethylbenzimidazole (cobb) protein [Leptomonas seymouri]
MLKRTQYTAYRCITVLTGAGISAESGIPTFRDSDGLWCSHRIEDVASPDAFLTNPELVQRFYNERRRNLLLDSVKPNKAHLALAELEKALKGKTKVVVVTQNIDNLHERAGSSNVVHMHGELLKVRCSKTGAVFPWLKDVNREVDRCPDCMELYTLRPHIVWFGEMPLFMEEIEAVLAESDLFVSIGTSGNVYPAAGFVQRAEFYGAQTVELNLESCSNSSLFQKSYFGKAGEIVPKWIKEVLEEASKV